MSEDLGFDINVVIRPTARGAEERFTVVVPSKATVLQLKEKTAESEQCTLRAEEMRLIYKGKILKDVEQLDAYGVGNDHVVHMVKGRAASAGCVSHL
jgi:ubiquilin